MAEIISTPVKGHNLILENRKQAVLTGVNEVESFDDHEVVLFTQLGDLKIKGKNLKIIKISTETGGLELTGDIDALIYGNNQEKQPKNIITRLFK